MKIMKKVFYGLLLGLFFTPVMGQSYSVNREAFSVKLHGNAYITSAKPVAEISEKRSHRLDESVRCYLNLHLFG